MIKPALARGLQLVGATTRKSKFLSVPTTSFGVLLINHSASLPGGYISLLRFLPRPPASPFKIPHANTLPFVADEYRKTISKDAALERRFQPVTIDEPTVASTISILRGLKPRYEVHHGVEISDGALVTG